VAGFTPRELEGIVRWPFYCMWRRIRDFAKAFKAQFFCQVVWVADSQKGGSKFLFPKCSKE
jgi:hypothetical protein